MRARSLAYTAARTCRAAARATRAPAQVAFDTVIDGWVCRGTRTMSFGRAQTMWW